MSTPMVQPPTPSEELARLHELAEELQRCIKHCNQPLSDEFPTAAIEALVNAIKGIKQVDTDDERQTLVFAQDKLRAIRSKLSAGPYEIERSFNTLFIEVDTLLNHLPRQELIHLGPSLNEPALAVRREELETLLEALERRVEHAVQKNRQSITLIDQSKRYEFNLIRVEVEAFIKLAAILKAQLVDRIVDLRWLAKLTERAMQISKSLGDGIDAVGKLLGQFPDLQTTLRHVRELNRKVGLGAFFLIRHIRQKSQPDQVREIIFRDIEVSWCPEMVMLPAGRFMMGSSAHERGRDDLEGPRHEVTISKPFALGRYPVTIDEYDYFCDATGREKPHDEGWGRGRRPVIRINQLDAEAYCSWLSKQTGRSYRLPTEAEWEYACRAGTTTRYAFGDRLTKDQANFDLNVGKSTEVGFFPANSWGVYDMHGNVLEWCDDGLRDYKNESAIDPRGPTSGAKRALRGGSWYDPAQILRSARRIEVDRNVNSGNFGFRCVRAIR